MHEARYNIAIIEYKHADPNQMNVAIFYTLMR